MDQDHDFDPVEVDELFDKIIFPTPKLPPPKEARTVNKGPCTPREIAVLGIARTLLSVNTRLMDELAACHRVRLEIEGGYPVLYPDIAGWAVTKCPGGDTGMIRGPVMLAKAHQLPIGSKWVMVRDQAAKCWRGRPLRDGEYQSSMGRQRLGPTYRQLPDVAAYLVTRLIANGVVTLAAGANENTAKHVARQEITAAWADVTQGG